jgi:alcohol dehydrogenase class IV
MTSGPPRWTLDELAAAHLSAAAVWASPSVAAQVAAALPWSVRSPDESDGPLDATLRTLIVVGGGTLIDRAKRMRHLERPALRLVACASLWGSGAEVSPIAVTRAPRGDRKQILMAPGVAPDARVVWPALADTVPDALVRPACGDVWSHAIEALTSPLASEAVVARAAALIARLLDTPLARDPRWFDLGAEACLVQAASSVGLVHGIAHTIEGPLALGSDAAVGHAALCATFLWPVLRLGQSISTKLADRCAAGGLDAERIVARAHELHDPALYDRARPFVEARWRDILRDPCTRTNGALIRPAHVAFFGERSFA